MSYLSASEHRLLSAVRLHSPQLSAVSPPNSPLSHLSNRLHFSLCWFFGWLPCGLVAGSWLFCVCGCGCFLCLLLALFAKLGLLTRIRFSRYALAELRKIGSEEPLYTHGLAPG